ncbi:hypothetical protein AVEN_50580-1 [Araneus ventricosus]|uniref:Uncharacterized protein n=1 Tax=Araneus ventricosus TaxID=182803 RepID=A0A4Y2ASQ4_ARAVE|nr:hypothetical protein AVEN_50580-1 [Araneus ventricosus]
MNFVFLCAVAFFAVVHSQEPSSDELKNYSSCYEYVLCKDPSSLKEFNSCLSSLNPEDFQTYFNSLKKNFVPFKSDNLSGAINEFCSYNDSKEKRVFDKTVNADYTFQKKSGADGEESIESGLEQATNCVYKILKKENSRFETRACCEVNSTSKARRPHAGVVRKFGGGDPVSDVASASDYDSN